MSKKKNKNTEFHCESLVKLLDDNKAEDIVSIDVRGKTSLCDFMIVCSGNSSRQTASLGDKVLEKAKSLTGKPAVGVEGKSSGDWILVDLDDIIIHIFRPEVREFYQIERMWEPTDPNLEKVTVTAE